MQNVYPSTATGHHEASQLESESARVPQYQQKQGLGEDKLPRPVKQSRFGKQCDKSRALLPWCSSVGRCLVNSSQQTTLSLTRSGWYHFFVTTSCAIFLYPNQVEPFTSSQSIPFSRCILSFGHIEVSLNATFAQKTLLNVFLRLVVSLRWLGEMHKNTKKFWQ